ncbi:MAG: hypothetical protein KDA20_09980 [Phycisphaerales bacterium]|nr:hypothetical protein [Phycisphaerales bacterium]
MTIATRMRRMAILAACVLGAIAPTSLAQNQNITVNDLRRENDALRQKIDQMSSQLDQSTKKVDDLEERIRQLTQQIEALQRQLASQGAAPQDPSQTPVAAEPMYATPSADEPYTSPDALFLAVQADYQKARTEQKWESMEEPRQRRMVADWARGAGRKFRSRVEWVVNVSEVRNTPNGAVVVGQVMDAASGQPFGSMDVTLELNSTFARKLHEHPRESTWRVVGNVSAAPRMNPERTEQGFFNVPAFVGPYAEFLFELRVTGLAPASEPKDTTTNGQER